MLLVLSFSLLTFVLKSKCPGDSTEDLDWMNLNVSRSLLVSLAWTNELVNGQQFKNALGKEGTRQQ